MRRPGHRTALERCYAVDDDNVDHNKENLTRKFYGNRAIIITLLSQSYLFHINLLLPITSYIHRMLVSHCTNETMEYPNIPQACEFSQLNFQLRTNLHKQTQKVPSLKLPSYLFKRIVSPVLVLLSN